MNTKNITTIKYSSLSTEMSWWKVTSWRGQKWFSPFCCSKR